MAKISFKNMDEYALRLARISASGRTEEISRKALHAGAGIMADELRAEINALPEEKMRFLRGGDQFVGITATNKKDLLDGMGITPIEEDKKGFLNAKVGWEGYGSVPTKKYPKGIPNALLARSIERGSSVRVKNRFVSRATNRARPKAIKAMDDVINSEIEKIMK